MKACSKCNVEFPANNNYFGNDKNREDGLFPQCKDCRTKYTKTHYKENKKRLNEKNHKYRINNLEKVKAYETKRREENPDRVKIWRKDNPDKLRSHERKQTAKNLGNVHEDWSEKELFEKFGTDCYICNNPIDFDAPKKGPGSDYSSWPDHMTPTSRGGENTIKNVRPCHKYCNKSKSNKTYEEYMLTANSQDIVTQLLW